MIQKMLTLIVVLVFTGVSVFCVSSTGFAMAGNGNKKEAQKIETAEEKLDEKLGLTEAPEKAAVEEEEEVPGPSPFEARPGFQQQPQIATTEERR